MSFSLRKNHGAADRSSLRTELICFVILALALLFAANAHAAVRSSANFIMNSDVLDSGGGSSSSSQFNLNGTIGQSSPVGPASSTNFGLISGFIPPRIIIIFANDVVVNIPGSGVLVLLNDNTSSIVLDLDTAEAIAVADVDGNGVDDIIASFLTIPVGTFISKNGGPLLSISGFTAELITAGNFDGLAGEDLFLDFGADGLGSYLNDTSVVILTPFSPIAMASGDVDNSGQDDVVLSFAGFRTIVFKDFSFPIVVLDPDPAKAVAVADVDNNGVDDVIVSFPAGTGPDNNGGTYISRNQGTLVSLSPLTAELITTGNYDGLPGEDLFLDFGAGGLGSYLNDTRVIIHTPRSPLAMASGDVDNSGQDDAVLSFDGLGTIVVKNFSLPFVRLNDSPALDIATGNVDGN